MEKLSEKTWVPVSFVMILGGGVFWLSSLYSQTQANAESVSEIKIEQKDQRKEIIERLNILDLKIDRLLGQK